jgi:hypothetical protein
MKMIVSLSVACVLCVMSAPAWACSLAENAAFEVDDSLMASELPEPMAVNVTIEEFTRGYADPRPTRRGVSSSCDDLGMVLLDMGVEQPDVGYEFALSSGLMPEGARLPTAAVHTYLNTSQIMLISWIDEQSYVQEEVDFWVTVTPVNKAGVRGSTSAPIHIYDPGRSLDDVEAPGDIEEPGCHQVRPAKLPTLLWVMMCGVIVFGMRRRVVCTLH